MNLELLPPLENQIPQFIECCLKLPPADAQDAVVCAWNHSGTHLAVGYKEGLCVVWDRITGGITARLDGHVRRINSLSWSFDDRYLLSAGGDWQCIIWDIAKQPEILTRMREKSLKVRFDCALTMAEFSPSTRGRLAVCLESGQVCLIDLTMVTTKKDEMISQKYLEGEDYSCLAYELNKGGLMLGTKKGQVIMLDLASSSSSSFTPNNNNNNNNNNQEKKRYELRITNAGIKQIKFGPSEQVLINANDRTLRLYQAGQNGLELLYKLTDSVDRLQWNQALFSSDGEYIVGAYAHKVEHQLFLWNRHNHAVLEKILEGPKETALDVSWHPLLPILASVSSAGKVYVWNVLREELWSAYNPLFREMESNTEYHEPEDEFDFPSLSHLTKQPSRLTTTEKEDGEICVWIEGGGGGEEMAYPPSMQDEELSSSSEGEVLLDGGEEKD